MKGWVVLAIGSFPLTVIHFAKENFAIRHKPDAHEFVASGKNRPTTDL
jgi:hypothetical protein